MGSNEKGVDTTACPAERGLSYDHRFDVDKLPNAKAG